MASENDRRLQHSLRSIRFAAISERDTKQRLACNEDDADGIPAFNSTIDRSEKERRVTELRWLDRREKKRKEIIIILIMLSLG